MPTWTTGGYTFPNYRPATPDPAPEITAGQRKAARDAGATHIGRDGLTCYSQRGSVLKWAYWKPEARGFSTWLPCEQMAEGAVKVDG
jgi:hypothetical protein